MNPRDYFNKWYTGSRNFIGSTGRFRDFKWKHIDLYINPINEVVDVGCGNLTFWKGKLPVDYTGIDFSENIIKKNSNGYPSGTFITRNAAELIIGLHKEVVFCLDVLFHIMDDDDFNAILHNLCTYSNKWIFIYTWCRPRNIPKKGIPRIYREFSYYMSIFDNNGFELVGKHENPADNAGALYVFRRIQE